MSEETYNQKHSFVKEISVHNYRQMLTGKLILLTIKTKNLVLIASLK